MSVTNKSLNIPVDVTGYVTLGTWLQSFGSTVVGPKKPYLSQGLRILGPLGAVPGITTGRRKWDVFSVFSKTNDN